MLEGKTKERIELYGGKEEKGGGEGGRGERERNITEIGGIIDSMVREEI